MKINLRILDRFDGSLLSSPLALGALVLCWGAAYPAAAVDLNNPKEKASYAMGLNMASQAKQREIEIDAEALLQGVKDAISGGQTLITEEQARETLRAYYREAQTKMQEKRKQQAEKNKKEGETFLAENAKKEGVKTLPSGLQYKVLAEGSGASPSTNDTVVTQYRGTLIDGTEFDSSYKRGQPATFGVTRVIKGWTEALQLMKPGAKWQLFIPSNLAYGDAGTGNIAPGSTLLFEIELLSVQAPVMPPAPPSQPVVTSDIIKVPSAEELKKGAKIEIIKQPPTPDTK